MISPSKAQRITRGASPISTTTGSILTISSDHGAVAPALQTCMNSRLTVLARIDRNASLLIAAMANVDTRPLNRNATTFALAGIDEYRSRRENSQRNKMAKRPNQTVP